MRFLGTPRGTSSRGASGERGRQVDASPGGQALASCRTCGYSGKPNHIADECWRKMQKCLRCGRTKHRISSCPFMDRGETLQTDRPNPRQVNVGGNKPRMLAKVYTLDQHQVPNSTE